MKRKLLLMIGSATILAAMAAPGQWVPMPRDYDRYPPGDYALSTRGFVPSDLNIRNNLNRAFFEDSLLNSVGLRARISGGVVTLSGRADNTEDVARAVWHSYNAGATMVINQLRIGP